MNTAALQQLMVQASPKVQDYFGDLFGSPFRLLVTFNYFVGIINRFTSSGSSPSANPVTQNVLNLPEYKDLQVALKNKKTAVQYSDAMDALNQFQNASNILSYQSFVSMFFGVFTVLKAPDSYGGSTMIYQYISLAGGVMSTGLIGWMYMSAKYLADGFNVALPGFGDLFLNEIVSSLLRIFFLETLPNFLDFFYLRSIAY